MKKVVKLFLLVITCLFVFSLTSCAKGSFKEAELTTVTAGSVVAKEIEGKTFVGYFTFDEESKTGTLYLVGAIIPVGEYEPVYVDNKDLIKDEKDGSTYYEIILNLAIGFFATSINNLAHIGGLIGGVLVSMAVGVKYKSNKSDIINGIIMTLIFTSFLVYMIFFR